MKKITFVAFSLITFLLSGQNEIMSSTDEFYDGMNWINSSGTNYEYDANGNLITETGFNWNFISSSWEYSYEDTNTFNTNDKVTQTTYKSWDNTLNTFVNEEQETYTYVNGNLTEIIEESWMANDWVNEYRTTISYDGSLPDEIIDYKWNGQWDLDERTVPAFNGTTLEMATTERRNGMVWELDSRVLYTYDSNDRLMEETYEDRNGSNWEEESSIEYTYDASGNLMTEVYKTPGGGVSTTETYTYDNGALMSSFKHPFKDRTGFDYIAQGFPYINKLLSATQSNFRTVYDYNNSIVLNAENFESSKLNLVLYPNPVNDFVNINLSNSLSIQNIELFNVLGEQVLNRPYASSVYLGDLQSGIYFLKVTANTGASDTRKLFKL